MYLIPGTSSQTQLLLIRPLNSTSFSLADGAQNHFSDKPNNGGTAVHINQDDQDSWRTQTNAPNQHHRQLLPPISASPIEHVAASGSGSNSRKRKARQSLQPQPPPPPPVDMLDEITNDITVIEHHIANASVNEQIAPPTTIRSELEWARYNNLQEADAVFNGQQVRRANLHRSTQKAYDTYRGHWFVGVFSEALPSLY